MIYAFDDGVDQMLQVKSSGFTVEIGILTSNSHIKWVGYLEMPH